VAPAGTKESFYPLAFGTGTKGLFGSYICGDKCKGSKLLSVVVNAVLCLEFTGATHIYKLVLPLA